ncbi:MAG: DUF1513 domain-containing protein [Moraxellaceae bacterium]|nr:DUF1513 domain-containing protein [Moraxellaceae bacterium]
MKNNQHNQSNQFTNISNTLGLSLIMTSLGVATHHLLRKKYNPNAKVSDYFYGLAEKIEQLENKQFFPQNKVQWVSGVANINNGESDEFSVIGIDSNRQIVWQTPISERVHDIVVQPIFNHPLTPSLIKEGGLMARSRHVAVIGRRPSENFWIMDCQTGQILHHIQAEQNRHFYGHACYSLHGDLLYVSENNTANFNGIIGIYQVNKNYQKISEFPTHGIGPHEIILHPNGDKLIIANGGIKTERASREELNLDTMQPSLVYLSLKKDNYGAVLQQVFLKHNQMSIRHLSVTNNGEVAIAIQFQGEKHLDMPLVLTHNFGDKHLTEYISNTLNKDWRQFHHYIASIKVNSVSNLLCVTSPLGGCVSVFDMQSKTMLDTVKITDCAGIAVAGEGFLVSNGEGRLILLKLADNKIIFDDITHKLAFDNHMQSL